MNLDYNMLITNFSSGELSNTLFGRTDIAQYYQGASLLENFDVIPTGGIKRRAGTQRIKELENNGRIIPFIINRNLSYLLHLAPDNITIYKIENGQVTNEPDIFESDDELRLFNSLDEIIEVQYAQNHDTMILCHQNYQPIIISLINDRLSINKFSIDTEVERVAHEDINTFVFFEKDTHYEKKEWLSRENEWPKTVTFFNGRLIFAGTRNSPQRVFVSSADNIRKFTTYKKFITEKREYITILNAKVIINSNKIQMLEPGEFGKFTKDLSEYFVQAPYYPERTMLAGIIGNELFLTNNTNELSMNSTELGFFITWKNNAEAAAWSDPLTILKIYPNRTINDTYAGEYKIQYHPAIGFRYGKTYPISHEPVIELQNISECVNNINYLYNFIYERIGSPKSSGTEGAMGSIVFYENTFNQFINAFHTAIQNTMKYPVYIMGTNLTLYGTPAQIYQQILSGINHESTDVKTGVAFYTKDYIIDSYPTPDCGFTFEIASDLHDAIQWLIVNKGLIIGTETSEWIIPPGVYAGNVVATLNSRYGSDLIQGAAIGDAACFFQTGKKALVEYYIPQEDNNFRANNMALMSDNMLRESPALEFDFITSPYTRLFITREDGIAATLLYERSTGTFAWSRLTTNGKIKSIAVIPGVNGYDDIYMLVKRFDKYFLEVLQESSDVYIDSCMKYNGDTSNYENGFIITDDGFIGYPYTSRIRSMPIIANNKMKPNNIKNLLFRFLDSCLPKIKALPNGQINTITANEPFTGVWKIIFPGVWDSDVMFELIHDSPTRCKILAINAEVN